MNVLWIDIRHIALTYYFRTTEQNNKKHSEVKKQTLKKILKIYAYGL